MVLAVVVLTRSFVQDPHTGWIEGTAILCTVMIVVTVASFNDYQKDKQFRALNKKKCDIPIKVVRGGRNFNVSIYELVRRFLTSIYWLLIEIPFRLLEMWLSWRLVMQFLVMECSSSLPPSESTNLPSQERPRKLRSPLRRIPSSLLPLRYTDIFFKF